VTLSHTSFCVVSPRKRKRKEKKRNINNDLAVLPSHDKKRSIREKEKRGGIRIGVNGKIPQDEKT